MFCKNCGQQIEDGSTMCPYCGKILAVAAPAASYTSNNAQAVKEFKTEEIKQPEPVKYDIDNSKNSELVKTLNGEITRLNEEIEDFEKKIKESDTEISEYNKKIKECNENISKFNQEINGRKAQISSVQNTISVLS